MNFCNVQFVKRGVSQVSVYLRAVRAMNLVLLFFFCERPYAWDRFDCYVAIICKFYFVMVS